MCSSQWWESDPPTFLQQSCKQWAPFTHSGVCSTLRWSELEQRWEGEDGSPCEKGCDCTRRQWQSLHREEQTCSCLRFAQQDAWQWLAAAEGVPKLPGVCGGAPGPPWVSAEGWGGVRLCVCERERYRGKPPPVVPLASLELCCRRTLASQQEHTLTLRPPGCFRGGPRHECACGPAPWRGGGGTSFSSSTGLRTSMESLWRNIEALWTWLEQNWNNNTLWVAKSCENEGFTQCACNSRWVTGHFIAASWEFQNKNINNNPYKSS